MDFQDIDRAIARANANKEIVGLLLNVKGLDVSRQVIVE
jgi:hypothetical protein